MHYGFQLQNSNHSTAREHAVIFRKVSVVRKKTAEKRAGTHTRGHCLKYTISLLKSPTLNLSNGKDMSVTSICILKIAFGEIVVYG